MKSLISGIIANVKNSKKYIFRLFPIVFLSSLLIVTVLIIRFPTFFLQKASPVGQNLTDSAIAAMSADQLFTQSQDYTTNVLNLKRPESSDKESVSKISTETILKERQVKSQERKRYMKVLLEKDTDKFLRIAVPEKVIANLDPNIKDNFEKEVSLEGEIENITFDNFKDKKSGNEIYLKTQEGRLRIYTPDVTAEIIKTGTKVKINGFRIDNKVATAKIEQQNVKNEEISAVSVGSTQVKKLAVVLLEYQDRAKTPWSNDEIEKWLFTDKASLNGYYKEVSFGQIYFEGKVFGPVTVPLNGGNNCDTYYDGSTKAMEILQSQGVNFEDFDYIAFNFDLVGCWASAWANVDGKYSWFNNSLLIFDENLPTAAPGASPKPYIPITRAGIAIHEIGHNLGMYHANSYQCTNLSGTKVPISLFANCYSWEYGDPFDVMGSQYGIPGHVNNYHKGLMGWLPSFETKTTSIAGKYDLYAIERNFWNTTYSPARIQSFRIPVTKDPSTGKQLYYYLEYRKKLTGVFDQFETNDLVVNGISVRLAPGYGVLARPGLLDITPVDNTFADPVIKPGKTFNDTLHGIKITAATPSANTNSIPFTLARYTPTCVRRQPLVDLYPISSWGKPGETLAYSLKITNMDNPGCGASTFKITPTLFSGWTQTTEPTAITLSPEKVSYMTVRVTSSQYNPTGYFSFTEKVVHPAGDKYSSSISANYNVYYSDSTPPTINIISPTSGQIIPSGYSMYIEAEISDNTEVTSADAYIDNNIGVCWWGVGPYRCYFNISNLNPGTHTLTVGAFDIVYNLSTKSVTFEIPRVISGE